ncbi:hypothetical protein OEA41_005185 [Lepraria neglecta]|uniref:Uncharacterized protein n=1 Tax=Lepraria neglecta TaxID=209136 RepID=A0AAD9Z1Q5_9LECA|nr:hypothetical protein OEA41_005185 [Lepraria neglecta]
MWQKEEKDIEMRKVGERSEVGSVAGFVRDGEGEGEEEEEEEEEGKGRRVDENAQAKGLK